MVEELVLQTTAHHCHHATWHPRGRVVAGVVVRHSEKGTWPIKKSEWMVQQQHLHPIDVPNHFINNHQDCCINIPKKEMLS